MSTLYGREGGEGGPGGARVRPCGGDARLAAAPSFPKDAAGFCKLILRVF